ncbi:MAG: sulfite exporter TauE/SafE family protein [Rhodospirillaceae bacterium]|nr:sulfite exporter TauE/SafE family protein [Rhodospirillaceae bacterium]
MNEAGSYEFLTHLSLLKNFESIYGGVLVMGFFYGLTLCSFSCLPLIGSYVFGTQDKFEGGFFATVVFIIFKVSTYGVIGALSGLAGSVVLETVKPGWFLCIGGLLIMLVGIAVWRRRASCRPHGNLQDKTKSKWQTYRHMATMGVVTSLMPCLPLSAVLLYAASTKSMVTGGVLALLFGLGTSASPIYYIGGAAGWFSGKIRKAIPQHQSLLQRLSSVIVILMGVKLFLLGSTSLTGAPSEASVPNSSSPQVETTVTDSLL